MQKAHDLHNSNKNASESKKASQPSSISIGNRAHRLIQDVEMPAIEELADKENDTFAQGGPLSGLAKRVSNEARRKASKERSGLRSASHTNKPPIGMVPRSVEVDVK